MKKIDCPLCGAKDAITYTEPEIFTDFTPGPAGIIGNSKMGFLGGGYDWSHANACPKLQKVKYPKELLEYFVTGEPEMVHSDFLTFEDYNHFLRLDGFEIIPSIIRENDNWMYKMRIKPLVMEKGPFLVTKAKDPDRAFSLLRHRLICGEIIEIGKSQFQLCRTTERVKLIEIKK